jgi:hypothetical protein
MMPLRRMINRPRAATARASERPVSTKTQFDSRVGHWRLGSPCVPGRLGACSTGGHRRQEYRRLSAKPSEGASTSPATGEMTLSLLASRALPQAHGRLINAAGTAHLLQIQPLVDVGRRPSLGCRDAGDIEEDVVVEISQVTGDEQAGRGLGGELPEDAAVRTQGHEHRGSP